MEYKLSFVPGRDRLEEIGIEWGPDQKVTPPLIELPQKFLDWQLKHRIANLNFFRSKKESLISPSTSDIWSPSIPKVSFPPM